MAAGVHDTKGSDTHVLTRSQWFLRWSFQRSHSSGFQFSCSAFVGSRVLSIWMLPPVNKRLFDRCGRVNSE